MLKWLVLALLAAFPASAATMKAVYTGTVADGVDQTGIFGQSNGDLTGLSFVATFLYDTAKGQRGRFPTSDSVSGGSLLVGDSPVLWVRLTISGQSYQYAPATIGAATVATDGVALTRTEHRGERQSSDGTTDLVDILLMGLRAPVVIVPDLDQPLSLTDDDSFYQGSFLFARTDIASGINNVYTAGRLYVDSVEIAPIPLPAAGGAMLVGLGALVAVRRRRLA